MERPHQPASCTHRWILGDPRFGKVEGLCRRCGAQRAFPSGLELLDPTPEVEELTMSEPVFAPEGAQEEQVPV